MYGVYNQIETFVNQKSSFLNQIYSSAAVKKVSKVPSFITGAILYNSNF